MEAAFLLMMLSFIVYKILRYYGNNLNEYNKNRYQGRAQASIRNAKITPISFTRPKRFITTFDVKYEVDGIPHIKSIELNSELIFKKHRKVTICYNLKNPTDFVFEDPNISSNGPFNIF